MIIIATILRLPLSLLFERIKFYLEEEKKESLGNACYMHATSRTARERRGCVLLVALA